MWITLGPVAISALRTVGMIPGISPSTVASFVAQAMEIHLGKTWEYGDSSSTSSVGEAGLCVAAALISPSEEAKLV